MIENGLKNKNKSGVILEEKGKKKSTIYSNNKRLLNWRDPERSGIIGLALVFGLLMWVFDAIVDYFVFYPGYGSFIEVLVMRLPPDEIYMRLVILICFVVFGWIISFHISKRKQTEEESKLTEEKYRRLFEQSPVSLWEEEFSELYAYLEELRRKGIKDFRSYFDKHPNEIIICTKKVNIFNVNQAALKLHNAKSKKQLLGNLDKIFTEKSIDVFKEELIAIAAGRLEFESEAEVKTLDGEPRQIFLKLRIDENQTGSKSALLAIIDITERKQAEKELQKKEAELNAIFQNTPLVIMLVDRERRVVKLNSQALLLSNQSEEDTIGLRSGEAIRCVHAFDDPKGCGFGKACENCVIRNTVLETFRVGKEFHRVEALYHHNSPDDGTKDKNILITTTPLQELDEDLVLVCLEDITERKQAEKELRRMASIVTDSNDAITLQDLEGNILAWNKGAIKLYGYSEEEAKKMNIINLIPEEKKEEGKDFIAQIKSGELVASFETQRKTKEGKFVDIWLVVTKIEDSEGKIIGIATTERDITERKQTEKELAEYQEHLEELIKERTAQLEESNQALKDFAYVVSHDLKAPLRAINQLSYWIAKDYEDAFDEDGKEQLTLLSSRVRRMDSLIEGILKYSRVGRVIEREETISFNNLAKDVIASLEVPKNIKIKIVSKLPVYVGDKTRFIQVFQNLISNSIKFMDKPKGWVNIGCLDEDEYWKFWVEDNGPGIEEKYFDKVFQIFQTLQPRDEQEGTGIGLTLAKKIISLYKGKVWLESIAGEGLTVFFTLPKEKIRQRKHKGKKMELEV